MTRITPLIIALAIVLSGCREDEPQKPKEQPVRRVEPSEKTAARDWVTMGAVAIPILVLAFAASRIRRAIEARDGLRLAELAIGADSPEEAADRIRLAGGFMGRIPPIQGETAAQKLVSERVNRAGLPAATVERRIRLIRMLAEFPDRREQILKDWETCFGDGETWAFHQKEPRSGNGDETNA